MKRKLLYLAILLHSVLFSSAQSPKFSVEFINQKDTQCVKMIRYYNGSETAKLIELFPNYQQYTTPLNEIRKLAKEKTFRMKPNFLNSFQDEKTKIILCMSKSETSYVFGYIITFSSNLPNSKIESIVRDKRFDLKGDKEESFEIKKGN